MVQVRNGAWQECRVLGWQPDGSGGWRCHLAWGVSGTMMHGWYEFDPERIRKG